MLPGLWSLTPLGAMVGMLVLQFYWLASSRLYTRKQHDEIMTLERRRGDEWKETATVERAAREALSKQLDVSLEANKAWETVFRSASGMPPEDTWDKRPKGGQ